jgi:hypothetical protein
LVSGAAIKNNSFTGFPSKDLKSAPSGITIADTPGAVIHSPLPCGIAISSPIPVELCFSLCVTSSKYFCSSLMLPFFVINLTAFSMSSSLFFAFTFKSIEAVFIKSVIFIIFLLSILIIHIFLLWLLKIQNLQLLLLLPFPF